MIFLLIAPVPTRRASASAPVGFSATHHPPHASASSATGGWSCCSSASASACCSLRSPAPSCGAGCARPSQARSAAAAARPRRPGPRGAGRRRPARGTCPSPPSAVDGRHVVTLTGDVPHATAAADLERTVAVDQGRRRGRQPPVASRRTADGSAGTIAGPMFESLSDRFDGIFTRLRGKGRLTEADVDEVLREIRVALLEADVNLTVVRGFVNRVRERAVGEELSDGPEPRPAGHQGRPRGADRHPRRRDASRSPTPPSRPPSC